MQQSKEVRDQLVKDLNIPKTGGVEVTDGEVVTDGYNQADLLTLTVEKLSDYVGQPASDPLPLARLWEITCAKAYSELHPPELMIVPGDENPVQVAPEPLEPTVIKAEDNVTVEPAPLDQELEVQNNKVEFNQ